MNYRLLLSLFISALINILFILFLLDLMKVEYIKEDKEKKIPIKLNYSKVENRVEEKRVEKKIPTIKEQPKKIEPKKTLITKKQEPAKEKTIEKKVLKKENKIPKNINTKKIEKKDIDTTNTLMSQKYLSDYKDKTQEDNKKKSISSLSDMLSQIDDEDEKLNKIVTSLYTDEELKNISKVQKKFLNENLDSIAQITQYYLNRVGYPEVAIRLRATGTTLLEFYLFPDGYISDIKILTSSGYESLDKNSSYVIEIAHRRYPKPKEKTLIRVYIQYIF